MCSEEVWAACNKCLCYLCYNHFLINTTCSTHNIYFFETVPAIAQLASVPSFCQPLSSSGAVGVATGSSEHSALTPVIPFGCAATSLPPGVSQLPSVPSFCQPLSSSGAVEVATGSSEHSALTPVIPFGCAATSLPPGVSQLASVPSFCQPLSSSGAVEVAISSPEHSALAPDDFPVDGEPLPLSAPLRKTRSSRNVLVKYNRNRGIAYQTEKSNNLMPSKIDTMEESKCTFCKARGLDCSVFSLAERLEIRQAFYKMADLQNQRDWILRHVSTSQLSKDAKNKIVYYLQCSDNLGKLHVCRNLFTSTLGISVQQVRTVLNKVGTFGVLEGEGRDGRQATHRDRHLKEHVMKHINKFPRMESHYCRLNSKCQFLSSDLNYETMYKMYKKENPTGASLTFYKNVFRSANLKFHHPKKDVCGLCDIFHRSSDEGKTKLKDKFDRHTKEKEKSRELKAASKEKALTDEKFRVAVFDLQQVIYLPKTERSELFYKRRLACYNFTVFELASREGFCFVSHEGLTGRGSCEIASFLHRYLLHVDEEGCEKVHLYSDGCYRQNKNSIIPAMLMFFVERSHSVEEVTLHFFETNHGQSEGDAMHSTIERAMRKVGEMFVPSQLVTLIKMSRSTPRPYNVRAIQSSDINDWKTYSQGRGILRVRSTEAGTNVDWTKFMQLSVSKSKPDIIKFKYSHTDEQFEVLKISEARRNSSHLNLTSPEPLYPSGYRAIPEAKFRINSCCCSSRSPIIL